MYTIINSATGEEIHYHNMFRNPDIFPNLELGENEKVAYIPDELVSTLQSSQECIIAVDEEGTATSITVTKTMEQWRQENPLPIPPKSDAERIVGLENTIVGLMDVVMIMQMSQL